MRTTKKVEIESNSIYCISNLVWWQTMSYCNRRNPIQSWDTLSSSWFCETIPYGDKVRKWSFVSGWKKMKTLRSNSILWEWDWSSVVQVVKGQRPEEILSNERTRGLRSGNVFGDDSGMNLSVFFLLLNCVLASNFSHFASCSRHATQTLYRPTCYKISMVTVEMER